MKSGKLKRNFWLTAEIECMLNLLKEVKVNQGSPHPTTTHNTFAQIANKMKRHGFPNKSPTQVRRKWFQMKSAYLCYKKGNVDRLFLIPEKFRSVIAQFVESGNKVRRLPLNPPPANERKVQIQEDKPKSTVDTFLMQLKESNSLLSAEFNKMESALLSYEHTCQTVRDYNLVKYISSLKNLRYEECTNN